MHKQAVNTKVGASLVQDGAESTWLGRSSVDGRVGEHARTRVISEHYNWIKRRCRQLMQNDADALDAAQEVVILVHGSLPEFEGRSSVRTWLSSIVHNKCVDLMRRGQRHRLREPTEALMTLHQLDLVDAVPLDRDSRDAVHQALQSLPKQDREVLHLRFFGELPIAEIGALLGLSLSATKMRLYRALAGFKSAYQSGDGVTTGPAGR